MKLKIFPIVIFFMCFTIGGVMALYQFQIEHLYAGVAMVGLTSVLAPLSYIYFWITEN